MTMANKVIEKLKELGNFHLSEEEIRIGDLKVNKETIDNRTHIENPDIQCSECPICRDIGLPIVDGPCIPQPKIVDDKTKDWCHCKNHYDWDTLKESLLTEGYQPDKFDDGYIKVDMCGSVRAKGVGFQHRGINKVIDGSHRVILLKEIHGDDYMVKVIAINPAGVPWVKGSSI